MHRNKIALLILLISSLALVASCNSRNVGSVWNTTTITADGSLVDWNNYPLNNFEDNQISLGLLNDSTNLYMLLRFQNDQWARTIRMRGITLWIDEEGGKNKIFGLKYNGGPSLDDKRARPPQDSSQSPQNLPDDARGPAGRSPRISNVELIVLDGKAQQQVSIPTDGSEGPVVAYSKSEGFHNYEISIPLHLISDEFYGLNISPGQSIGLGAIWGGFDREGMRDRMGDGPPGGGMGGGSMPPGGGRGGMGGGPGGGMGGGPPGGGRGDRPNMPEKQELWIRAELAKAKVETYIKE